MSSDSPTDFVEPTSTPATNPSKKARWSWWIDIIINSLKWPTAWLSAFLTIPLLWSCIAMLPRIAVNPLPLLPFVGGTAAFILLWRRWLQQSRFGRFLITLEHEATHAAFALLTLHRIVGFRASIGRGGEVRFVGKGNWLITVAPYFFPTVALLLFLIAFFLPFPSLPWSSFLLGVALGYHVVSTYKETNKDQTDIKQLGLIFCWMFLPAANIAVVALLVSFAHDGSDGLSTWVSDICQPFQFAYDKLSETLVTASSQE